MSDIEEKAKKAMIDALTKDFLKSVALVHEAKSPPDLLKSILSSRFRLLQFSIKGLMLFGAEEDQIREVIHNCVNICILEAKDQVKKFVERYGTLVDNFMIDTLLKNVEEHLTASQKAAENKAP